MADADRRLRIRRRERAMVFSRLAVPMPISALHPRAKSVDVSRWVYTFFTSAPHGHARGHTLASPPFHSNKIHVEFYIYDSSFSNDTKWMQFWNQVIPTSLESPAPPRNSTTHIDINQHQDRDRRQTSRGSRVPLTAMRPRSTLAAFSFVVSRSQAFNPVSSSSARCRRRVHLPSTRGRHRPPNTSLQLGSEGGDNVSVTGPIYVSTEGPEIKLFTKEGCTLCDKVKEVLEAIKEDNPHSLYAVDITDDDKKEWFDKYK